MRTFFRPLLFCSLLMAGCSPQSKMGPVPATVKQKKQDLVSNLKQQGVFDSVQTSSIDRDFQIVSTSHDEQYFIKDGVVVSSSRKPNDRESALLYWRYQFKGKSYREKSVEGASIEGHGQALRELACDSLGMGVVYQPSGDRVTRVFYYEKK